MKDLGLMKNLGYNKKDIYIITWHNIQKTTY